jgi:hypothetical protein
MWCQGNFDSRVGCLMIRGSSRHLFSSCLLLQGRSSILLLVKKTGRAAAKSSSACVLRRFVFLLFSARAGPISVLTHALISAAVVRSCRSGAVPESVFSLVRRPCSIFSSAALEQFRSPALISRVVWTPVPVCLLLIPASHRSASFPVLAIVRLCSSVLALGNKFFVPNLVSADAGLKTVISALFLLLLLQPLLFLSHRV